MSERRFYYFIFSLLFSINFFVYSYKNQVELTKSIAIGVSAFIGAYLFASVVFRKLGWQKQRTAK
jgi:uncharacterized membrane protein YagU involved in acid resistance